ncbi:hypothetical protein V5O48_008133 [Marasmius crinis-equi]|uniref:Uncharacterized protein n=1 Tax=Marasmius crinis-equi TaxID=585013 RepID=A0ABR3FEP8_9AGAR
MREGPSNYGIHYAAPTGITSTEMRDYQDYLQRQSEFERWRQNADTTFTPTEPPSTQPVGVPAPPPPTLQPVNPTPAHPTAPIPPAQPAPATTYNAAYVTAIDGNPNFFTN